MTGLSPQAREQGRRAGPGRLYAFSCGYDDFVARREELSAAEIARQALFDKEG